MLAADIIFWVLMVTQGITTLSSVYQQGRKGKAWDAVTVIVLQALFGYCIFFLWTH